MDDRFERASNLLNMSSDHLVEMAFTRRASVVRWEWATWLRDPEPHAAQVHQRPVARPANSGNGSVRHGYDEAGQLAITEEPTSTPGRHNVTIWSHPTGATLRIGLDPKGAARLASVYTRENGQWLLLNSLFGPGNTIVPYGGGYLHLPTPGCAGLFALAGLALSRRTRAKSH